MQMANQAQLKHIRTEAEQAHLAGATLPGMLVRGL